MLKPTEPTALLHGLNNFKFDCLPVSNKTRVKRDDNLDVQTQSRLAAVGCNQKRVQMRANCGKLHLPALWIRAKYCRSIVRYAL